MVSCWFHTYLAADPRWPNQFPSWPAQAGHPRLSFDADNEDVHGGPKLRHDDSARALPNSTRLLRDKP
jgi:hypothetical protein